MGTPTWMTKYGPEKRTLGRIGALSAPLPPSTAAYSSLSEKAARSALILKMSKSSVWKKKERKSKLGKKRSPNKKMTVGTWYDWCAMGDEDGEAAVEESCGLGEMDAEDLMDTFYQGMKADNRLQKLGLPRVGRYQGNAARKDKEQDRGRRKERAMSAAGKDTGKETRNARRCSPQRPSPFSVRRR